MINNAIKVKKFDEFDVYYLKEGNSFVYADFNDSDKLIDGLTDYIFKEDNLLNFARKTSKIHFSGEMQQYVKLYQNIGMFLNSELETLSIGEIDEELKTVMGEEYKLIDANGELKVQKDKIGKIGEYTFHILLTRFFKLDCILPKFTVSTNRNMSVFGIDTLFLDIKNRVIYFGESKFSKDIDNGIKLANRSLKEYEHQIMEEYRYVLSNDDAYKISPEFNEIFGDHKQMCISFQQLIKKSDIKKIGVPVFIAHGNGPDKNTPEEYINKLLTKINREDFFGLKTRYILISLPVIDKAKYIEIAIKKAVKKQHEYEQRIG